MDHPELLYSPDKVACFGSHTMSELLAKGDIVETQAVTPDNFVELQTAEVLSPALLDLFTVNDRPTLEHSFRVATIGRMGALIHGFRPNAMTLVEVCGLTHDIGKANPEISALVNNKRSLTDQERETVNLHAQLGFEMLYPPEIQLALSLRRYLGPFMGYVALTTLFSHANAIAPKSNAPSPEYVDRLVVQGSIKQYDADSHKQLVPSQLLASSDVMDAVMSRGAERAYRDSEPDDLPNPTMLAEIVDSTVHVPSIKLARFANMVVRAYPTIQRNAHIEVSTLLAKADVDPRLVAHG